MLFYVMSLFPNCSFGDIYRNISRRLRHFLYPFRNLKSYSFCEMLHYLPFCLKKVFSLKLLDTIFITGIVPIVL